jgi:hypothetical protein
LTNSILIISVNDQISRIENVPMAAGLSIKIYSLLIGSVHRLGADLHGNLQV